MDGFMAAPNRIAREMMRRNGYDPDNITMIAWGDCATDDMAERLAEIMGMDPYEAADVICDVAWRCGARHDFLAAAHKLPDATSSAVQVFLAGCAIYVVSGRDVSSLFGLRARISTALLDASSIM